MPFTKPVCNSVWQKTTTKTHDRFLCVRLFFLLDFAEDFQLHHESWCGAVGDMFRYKESSNCLSGVGSGAYEAIYTCDEFALMTTEGKSQ